MYCFHLLKSNNFTTSIFAHRARNLDISISPNMNTNHGPPNSSATQSYDMLAQSLSSIPPINLVILVITTLFGTNK